MSGKKSKRVQVNMLMSPDLYEAMAHRMEVEGWTLSELIRRGLEGFLRDELDLLKARR